MIGRTMTTHRWMAVLIMLITLALPMAQAAPAVPAPIVRTQITPVQARVGETVVLELVILVPGWLTAPIELPAGIDMAGVQARLDEGAALNVNETINGIAYAGLRRRYQLVAQHAGQFSVPPVSFTVAFADGTRRLSQTLNSATGRFEATLPKGLEDLGYMLVTPDFRLQQSVDRKLVRLEVGDALVRTLDQRAVGIKATQLPVLRFAETPGLATYPEAPTFNETIGERGAANVATQTQRVTYVLERAGTYELPALELTWLDTRAGVVRTARAPALKFDVKAGVETPSATSGTSERASEHTASAAIVAVQPATDTRPFTLRVRMFLGRFWPWLAGIAFVMLAWRHRRSMTRSEP